MKPTIIPQVGKTYTVKDGAGFTAFRVDRIDKDGTMPGTLAVEMDGYDVIEQTTWCARPCDLIEEVGQVEPIVWKD